MTDAINFVSSITDPSEKSERIGSLFEELENLVTMINIFGKIFQGFQASILYALICWSNNKSNLLLEDLAVLI